MTIGVMHQPSLGAVCGCDMCEHDRARETRGSIKIVAQPADRQSERFVFVIAWMLAGFVLGVGATLAFLVGLYLSIVG